MEGEGVGAGIEAKSFGEGGPEGAGFLQHGFAVDRKGGGALALEGKVQALSFVELEGAGPSDFEGAALEQGGGGLIL